MEGANLLPDGYKKERVIKRIFMGALMTFWILTLGGIYYMFGPYKQIQKEASYVSELETQYLDFKYEQIKKLLETEKALKTNIQKNKLRIEELSAKEKLDADLFYNLIEQLPVGIEPECFTISIEEKQIQLQGISNAYEALLDYIQFLEKEYDQYTVTFMLQQIESDGILFHIELLW